MLKKTELPVSIQVMLCYEEGYNIVSIELWKKFYMHRLDILWVWVNSVSSY